MSHLARPCGAHRNLAGWLFRRTILTQNPARSCRRTLCNISAEASCATPCKQTHKALTPPGLSYRRVCDFSTRATGNGEPLGEQAMPDWDDPDFKAYPFETFTNLISYRAQRKEWHKQGLSVGFVPTMGALHEGHISLAREAKQSCDKVVVSIFVNPAQFAPHEDLTKYPKTLHHDLHMLKSAGVDALILPSVAEMYPSGITLDVSKQQGTFVSVQGKSHQMEGAIRPHFFRGVATVVTKLLNYAQPNVAFFGQKDAQQCAVVSSMARDLLIPTEIKFGETVRESDGLAMSSRNRYLNTQERAAAPILFKALSACEVALKQRKLSSRTELRKIAEDVIKSQHGVELQYISIAHPFTLEELENVGQDGAILSGAVLLGNVRIIDNLLLNITLSEWARGSSRSPF